MIELILHILAMAVFVFLWGLAWTTAADKDEAEFQKYLDENAAAQEKQA